jgi:pyruvate/2-oxoglutarate dehydrogenase complex dihydrolipoamide acyltransferase (E2) component
VAAGKAKRGRRLACGYGLNDLPVTNRLSESLMSRSQHFLRAPDLDLGEVPVVVSMWLTPLGAPLVEGDRVVELLAGDVTVDVSAPATGVLAERRVAEDEPVTSGQVLGVIVASA